MFGFSFGELVVLMIVAIVVIGPRDLPRVLRKAGQWAGKLRRMAADLRAQSGIDDVLRAEGLEGDINELRKLARGELDQVTRAARLDDVQARPVTVPAADDPYAKDATAIDRIREYPTEGPDAYGALPDHAVVYANARVPSPLANDALYMRGEAHGEAHGEVRGDPADAKAPVPLAPPPAQGLAPTQAAPVARPPRELALPALPVPSGLVPLPPAVSQELANEAASPPPGVPAPSIVSAPPFGAAAPNAPSPGRVSAAAAPSSNARTVLAAPVARLPTEALPSHAPTRIAPSSPPPPGGPAGTIPRSGGRPPPIPSVRPAPPPLPPPGSPAPAPARADAASTEPLPAVSPSAPSTPSRSSPT